MNYLGIDLGTSSVKVLLMNENGRITASVSEEYPLYFPKTGWSEQNPLDWYEKTVLAVKAVLKNAGKTEAEKVCGIGIGGQMHGLVVLDENDAVIRNAILWNDGRTDKETEFLNTVIGVKKLEEYTANMAFAGFTAPKILWMKENEPENYKRIRKIMLPKDYLAYRLCGVHCTDYSDASGMLLLDVKNKKWSKEMLEICGITEDMLPKLFESSEVVGLILPKVAEELGLKKEVKLVAGAGDNAAAAIGTGTVGSGSCNISLGTSGTVFISNDEFGKGADGNNALHYFCHADGKYHLMGCMLSAASCVKWFMEDVLDTKDNEKEQGNIKSEKLGKNEVYFLPYLMGERSPHNDSMARGTFIGMSMNTSRSDMLQAVMEGVAFALKDSLEIAKSLGIKIERTKICGGGAKSDLWKKIIANVLGIEVLTTEYDEGPGFGAAILAAIGCGEFRDAKEASDKLIRISNRVLPDSELTALYEKKYQVWKTLYPAMKASFALMHRNI